MSLRTVNTLHFMQQRLLDQIEKLSFFLIESLTKTSVITFLSPTRIPHSQVKIRQSKINSCWVAGPIGQTNRRPSV